MAFSGKVNYTVEFIISKEAFYQFTVAYITPYEETALIVYVIGNSSQISGIRQCIQYDNFYVVVLFQDVFDVIRTNEACRSCD